MVSPSKRNIIFALIVVAYFLDVVDFSIVQVALPSLREQLAVSLADSQWVIGAYGITLAGFLLLSGRAGDIYGQKKIFILGIGLFTLMSFIGGLAQNFTVLIITRAFQGIGAAMSTVTSFAIFMQNFPEGPERNRVMGIFIAVLSAGFAAGSVLGGVLTQLWGWRSVLFVNIPIGLISLYYANKYIEEGRQKAEVSANRQGQLDVPGAVTVTTGLILLTYSLTNAGNNEFSMVRTIIPFIAAIVIILIFWNIEKRARSPLMPPAFLSQGSILTANLMSLIMASTITGISFMITVYLQQILHYSPLEAGLAQLPGALIFFIIGGFYTSKLIDRFGAKRLITVSIWLVALGILLLTFMNENGNYWQILPGLILWALGASIGFPALNMAALSGIKPGNEGLASGILNTSFRVGAPMGLAVLLIIAGVTQGGASSNEAVLAGFRLSLIGAALITLSGLAIVGKITDTGQVKEIGNMAG